MSDIVEVFKELHDSCGSVLETTLKSGRIAIAGDRHTFLNDLGLWRSRLSGRPELSLIDLAQLEYGSALLSCCQGRYRSASKSLRLCLELVLQGVYLSVSELSLSEWLTGERDTVWAAIVDPTDGVFGTRFAQAFAPDLADRSPAVGQMARTLYRELSQAIHGSPNSRNDLPDHIGFSDSAFQGFMEKADTARMILHFSLYVRHGVDAEASGDLAVAILDRLGHIERIRIKLGGVVGG